MVSTNVPTGPDLFERGAASEQRQNKSVHSHHGTALAQCMSYRGEARLLPPLCAGRIPSKADADMSAKQIQKADSLALACCHALLLQLFRT